MQTNIKFKISDFYFIYGDSPRRGFSPRRAFRGDFFIFLFKSVKFTLLIEKIKIVYFSLYFTIAKVFKVADFESVNKMFLKNFVIKICILPHLCTMTINMSWSCTPW